MNSVPSEFINGLQVAASAWEGPAPEPHFPSPSKFEAELFQTFAPASTNNNHIDDKYGESRGSTTGILGTRKLHDSRSKTAPGVVSGEEVSEIFHKEESIPLQKVLRRPMSAASPPSGTREQEELSPAPFQSRKLTASGKRDPFLAVPVTHTGSLDDEM